MNDKTPIDDEYVKHGRELAEGDVVFLDGAWQRIVEIVEDSPTAGMRSLLYLPTVPNRTVTSLDKPHIVRREPLA